MNIDDPSINDNRKYDFINCPDSGRDEFRVIMDLIPPASAVIDLGCGNGVLLHQLQKERSAAVKGIELSASGVKICRSKGLDVVQGRIDEPIPFKDNSFDYAICNVTIQMVMYPEVLLKEMKRIARFQIISFPNFAFYRNRIQFALRGAMPEHMLYGYHWYNTGHIHQLSIKDFRRLVQDTGGLAIKEFHSVNVDNTFKQFLINKIPNLFMTLPVILLEKTG